jgi:carboxylesterase
MWGQFQVAFDAVSFDDEKTAPFVLGPPPQTARGSVLLLHGFSGSPWELRLLGEALAARGHHVVCPKLPGHGVSPEAMLFASDVEWYAAAVDSLPSDGAVDVVGLSMGALLALRLASEKPQRVRRLALLAPVVGLQGIAARALGLLRHRGLAGLTSRWVHKQASDIEDAAARAEAPLLPRYPLARVIDLLRLQEKALASVSSVVAPTLVALAENDHVVDKRAVEKLAARLRDARLLRLQRGFHILPRDLDRARLITEVAAHLE